MRVYDVTVTLTQWAASNPSNVKSITKEIFIVANSIQEAGNNAMYQLRGDVQVHPLFYTVTPSDPITTNAYVTKVTDLNLNCIFPSKYTF